METSKGISMWSCNGSVFIGRTAARLRLATYRQHYRAEKVASMFEDGKPNPCLIRGQICSEEPVEVHELIAAGDQAIEATEPRLKKIEQRIILKYNIHKWTFVTGLILLLAARAYLPVSGLIKNSGPQTACTSSSGVKAAGTK